MGILKRKGGGVLEGEWGVEDLEGEGSGDVEEVYKWCFVLWWYCWVNKGSLGA